MIEQGREQVVSGYATDRITDISLQWLQDRDPDRPFLLMCHHKAPHRPWEPSEAHAQFYRDEEIPYPATFDDDYRGRAGAAAATMMRVERDFIAEDVKVVPPDPAALNGRLIPPQGERSSLTPIAGGAVEFDSPAERKRWLYQRYIKDYLRCVASVDDGVGRLLNFLEEEGIVEETVVVYTSDQGFFLGDHGWYDKRFMYGEAAAGIMGDADPTLQITVVATDGSVHNVEAIRESDFARSDSLGWLLYILPIGKHEQPTNPRTWKRANGRLDAASTECGWRRFPYHQGHRGGGRRGRIRNNEPGPALYYDLS